MPYTTALAGTNADVLNALAAAAAGAGWTVLLNGEDNGGGTPDTDDYRQHVVWLSNGTSFVGMAFQNDTTASNLRLIGATGYDSNETSYLNQPTGTYLSGDHFVCASARYHIFSELGYIYLVLQTATGSYRHLGFGELIKNDSYSGGSFITTHRSSPANNYHDLPFTADANFNNQLVDTLAILWSGDSLPLSWHYNRADRAFPNKCRGSMTNSWALTQQLINDGSQQFNNQSVLLPIYCSLRRSGGFYSPCGYPPNIRGVNVRNISDGSIVQLGADDWMIFAAGDRNSSEPALTSGYTGFAYLVMP